MDGIPIVTSTGADFLGEKLRREALDVVAKGPDTFATLIATDVTKWAKVVKASGLQPQ